MKKALITGITGQDGAYLARFLLERGYRVSGTHRPQSDRGRLAALGIEDRVALRPADALDASAVREAVASEKPDEIYHLAAWSHVGRSFSEPLAAAEVTGRGALILFDAVHQLHPQARVFQASSSDMYGPDAPAPQDEDTPFRPRSPYGAGKLFAHHMGAVYRDTCGLFLACAILFNHESPLRSPAFVTRKIARAAARQRAGSGEVLRLGNLEARRDWGWAPDYVEAMWRMLQQQEPEDYVIATGRAHSVREFVELAFRAAGFDPVWEAENAQERAVDRRSGRLLVQVDPGLRRSADPALLQGNPRKARARLGWESRTPLSTIVQRMVESDIVRIQRGEIAG